MNDFILETYKNLSVLNFVNIQVLDEHSTLYGIIDGSIQKIDLPKYLFTVSVGKVTVPALYNFGINWQRQFNQICEYEIKRQVNKDFIDFIDKNSQHFCVDNSLIKIDGIKHLRQNIKLLLKFFDEKIQKDKNIYEIIDFLKYSNESNTYEYYMIVSYYLFNKLLKDKNYTFDIGTLRNNLGDFTPITNVDGVSIYVYDGIDDNSLYFGVKGEFSHPVLYIGEDCKIQDYTDDTNPNVQYYAMQVKHKFGGSTNFKKIIFI